jgi:serine/threonine-protein kinase
MAKSSKSRAKDIARNKQIVFGKKTEGADPLMPPRTRVAAKLSKKRASLAVKSSKRRKAAQLGQVFSSKRYKLGEQIGEGGMGAVYRANDTVLNMDVALKFLPLALMQNKDDMEKFKQEASIVMGLSHEHIMKLHNLEVEKSRMFLVMELIEGRNFSDILQESPVLPLQTILQIMECCARALDFAHNQGVIHKDLKPSNLMLTNSSILKIVDFGTAVRTKDAEETPDEEYAVGTPCYMSPEQLMNEPLDRRTDVYTLGAIAYEMLMGQPAFPFDVDPHRVLTDHPEPMSGVDPQIAAVITRAMSKSRDERWESCGQFSEMLQRAASHLLQN